MSGKLCAVCNKVLNENEIRINKRNLRFGGRKTRYLCLNCRRREYDNYQNSIKKIIDKK